MTLSNNNGAREELWKEAYMAILIHKPSFCPQIIKDHTNTYKKICQDTQFSSKVQTRFLQSTKQYIVMFKSLLKKYICCTCKICHRVLKMSVLKKSITGSATKLKLKT
jgi:hypothetical protein